MKSVGQTVVMMVAMSADKSALTRVGLKVVSRAETSVERLVELLVDSMVALMV